MCQLVEWPNAQLIMYNERKIYIDKKIQSVRSSAKRTVNVLESSQFLSLSLSLQQPHPFTAQDIHICYFVCQSYFCNQIKEAPNASTYATNYRRNYQIDVIYADDSIVKCVRRKCIFFNMIWPQRIYIFHGCLHIAGLLLVPFVQRTM